MFVSDDAPWKEENILSREEAADDDLHRHPLSARWSREGVGGHGA